MRTEFIRTKIRPIKKLFIIEPFDYDSFAELFIEIQDEIDIIQNLIFVNDEDLWSQPNKDFIKRGDPDIILNLSKLDDDKLSKHFNVFSVKPVTDHFKIGRFGTNLYSFSRRPTLLNLFDTNQNETFKVLSASELKNTPKSLLACINFGLYPKGEKNLLELTIFENLKATYLTKKEDIIDSLFKPTEKYIQLTTTVGGLGGMGGGSSVYEINYNTEGLFNDAKKYLFISDKNDFKTISFFWNTRSYYPYADIAWIPEEFLEDISPLVGTETIFICFSKSIEKKIQKQFATQEIIQPSRLHFSGRNERWSFLEHEQTISITDNEVIIQHPVDKSFSNTGYIGAFVLETRGLNEFLYPKRRSIGNLFFPKHHDRALVTERFQRISELGLSNYILEVSPFKATDITEVIVLPSFDKVIRHLFEEIGYEIKETPKSSILEQTVNLLSGVGGLKTVSDKIVFELLVALTPKVRTEKVVNKILEHATGKLTSDDVLDIIAEIKEKGAVDFPSVTLTIDDMMSRASVRRNDKKRLLSTLQKLYDQRVLLRGKYFECPSCSSKIWIQIDEINRMNHCPECSNLVNLPIFFKDKQVSDHFRLNQLIVRAVDQGQLSTLLPINLFFLQNYRGFEYLSNLELFKENKLVTDIDLFIKIGKKIGIVECKSASGFPEKQIDGLIKIASVLKCDFIAFSSLINSTSQELKDLVSILNDKKLEIPAFIFTNEALFNPKPRLIQKHFELTHSTKFKAGPIIIG